MDLTLRFPRMMLGLRSLAHVKHALDGRWDLNKKLACGYELMIRTKERLDTPCLYIKLGTFRVEIPRYDATGPGNSVDNEVISLCAVYLIP